MCRSLWGVLVFNNCKATVEFTTPVEGGTHSKQIAWNDYTVQTLWTLLSSSVYAFFTVVVLLVWIRCTNKSCLFVSVEFAWTVFCHPRLSDGKSITLQNRRSDGSKSVWCGSVIVAGVDKERWVLAMVRKFESFIRAG